MRISGIRIDETDMAAALDFLAAAINDNRENRRLRRVITLNPEGLYLATCDAAFARIVESADLVTPDGAGILWAARRLGNPLKERVTGIDLMQEACARAATEGWRVYLLGAKPGVAEEAAAKLKDTYAGLNICGLHHGYFAGKEHALTEQINQAAPDLLFVALGLPAQERFCADYQQRLKAAVAIGVGGSLDVLAGKVKRAPRFMRRLRLEWLWRLILQPSRLPRILVIPKFMWKVMRSKKI
ncbi:MAG: WecB/TagA/CpsF family glycosyltransferase [Clostridiales bacterium]|nr:WecB/TagA/CpsF family glycosyltransferase [Clostridiales bacterium]